VIGLVVLCRVGQRYAKGVHPRRVKAQVLILHEHE
jgi:hypothetical protein